MPSSITKNTDVFVKRGPDIVVIQPEAIKVLPGFNPRTVWNAQDHEDLKAYIKATKKIPGLLEIRYEDNQVILVDGERRLRAVKELIAEGEEIVGVPAMVVRVTNDADALFLALAKNQGVRLTPMEEAHACQRLLDYGHTPEIIAHRMGKSLATIHNRLMLLEADRTLVDALSHGDIQTTDVVQAVREARSTGKQQAAILEEKHTAPRGLTFEKLSAKQERKDHKAFQKIVKAQGLTWTMHRILEDFSVEDVQDALYGHASASLVSSLRGSEEGGDDFEMRESQ